MGRWTLEGELGGKFAIHSAGEMNACNCQYVWILGKGFWHTGPSRAAEILSSILLDGLGLWKNSEEEKR